MNILYEILVATVFSLLLSPHEKLKKPSLVNREKPIRVYLEGRTGIWYNLKDTHCENQYEISFKNFNRSNSGCCLL